MEIKYDGEFRMNYYADRSRNPKACRVMVDGKKVGIRIEGRAKPFRITRIGKNNGKTYKTVEAMIEAAK